MRINNLALDFTLRTYLQLLHTLSDQGFSFSTFEEYILNKAVSSVVLRHDVDTSPSNSLQFARFQAERGIKGTYYFRSVLGSYNEKIIKEIYSMGHEVGYHYEDVSLVAIGRQVLDIRKQEEAIDTIAQSRKSATEEELVELAIKSFKKNLEKLRKIVPVKTICMHGSPMSRWDSRLLWKYYDYRDFGIIGEPYFDVDFDEVLYLTDTGRRWDGSSVNIRDKATWEGMNGRLGDWENGRKDDLETKRLRDVEIEERSDKIPRSGTKDNPSATVAPSYHRTVVPFPKFHSTFDIIQAAEEGKLPDRIMMTFHPQRWTDNPFSWAKELIWQNTKNVVKYFLVKMR